MYERYKHSPPAARNLPTVASNIAWSRHLLKRIEEPMKKFEKHPGVLSSKDSKKIIKAYNKVAKTLVTFEFMWYQAWCKSIESAKSGLQATLIVRHPQNGRLYVNFDKEILRLIQEAKCLSRMGIDVPDSAKMVLFQQEKFKNYYDELTFILRAYYRILDKALPIIQPLLQPHFQDVEKKLRPGMVTLTWTSMNIDAYKLQVDKSLQHLDELISTVNDIVESRIEKNLKLVQKTLLVDLPAHQSFALDEFVMTQERQVSLKTNFLESKNLEVETAVDDVISLMTSLPEDSKVKPAPQFELTKLKQHYHRLMYQAILNCTKQSLEKIKSRVCARRSTGFLFVQRPFFEVDVQLAVPSVRLNPTLEVNNFII